MSANAGQVCSPVLTVVPVLDKSQQKTQIVEEFCVLGRFRTVSYKVQGAGRELKLTPLDKNLPMPTWLHFETTEVFCKWENMQILFEEDDDGVRTLTLRATATGKSAPANANPNNTYGIGLRFLRNGRILDEPHAYRLNYNGIGNPNVNLQWVGQVKSNLLKADQLLFMADNGCWFQPR